jgi:dTDP-4-amino-4,6-dideoxygalactose transaminase
MIPRARPNYNMLDLIRSVFRSRGDGSATRLVAAMLSRHLGLPHVVLTASGRGGLYLLLKATNHAGVIAPSYTCNAVAEAIGLAGGTLIPAEHTKLQFNQSLEDIEPHLQPGRCYIATHQYGLAVDIEAIAVRCQERQVAVYEDIAAALGTRVGGRPAGSFGKACFGSFDTTKLVNAPLKGGFIATADPVLYKRLKDLAATELRPMSFMRKCGLLGAAMVLVALRNPQLYNAFHWFHFRRKGRVTAETHSLAQTRSAFYRDCFADWQAAIVVPQLRKLQASVERRQVNYDRLHHALAGIPGIILPPARADADWAPIRFAIRIKGDKQKFYASSVVGGVDLGFSFSYLAAPLSHRNAQDIAAHVLNVPFDNRLSETEIQKMVLVFKTLGNAGSKDAV